jgi:fluoride exporter
MKTAAAVALGSALGGMARFGIGLAFAPVDPGGVPWDTLLANVCGSLLIGWIAGTTSPEGRWRVSVETRAFLTTGLCGGFTTFSFLSWQTLRFLLNGQPLEATLYSLGTTALALTATLVGWRLAGQRGLRSWG